MADRLVLPTHDPERHHRPPVLDQHAGDQRVERALARRDRARVAGNGAEPAAAVVQDDAAFGPHDAGAESREQRVDERARVAVAVDDAHVDRVLMARVRHASRCRATRRQDGFGRAPAPSIRRTENPSHRHRPVDEIGVGDEIRRARGRPPWWPRQADGCGPPRSKNRRRARTLRAGAGSSAPPAPDWSAGHLVDVVAAVAGAWIGSTPARSRCAWRNRLPRATRRALAGRLTRSRITSPS